MGRITFILGGARSGKSRFAQEMASGLVAQTAGTVLYLATAAGQDEEMERRIARHREGRPSEWKTIEEPRRVARILERAAGSVAILILDCLTLLISNILLDQGADRPDASPPADLLEQIVMKEVEDILSVCRRIGAHSLLISNEVGLAVVPATPLGRVFRDIAGRVNQRVARESEEVFLMIAGLAQKLK